MRSDKTVNLIAFVIAIILGAVSFYATNNAFVGGGVLIAGILFYFLLIQKPLNKHFNKVSRIHDCYLFINNFLVTLSIKESLNSSFEATGEVIGEEYKAYIEGVSQLTPEEKLIYLKKYFNFHIFHLFVDIVLLWMEEGGNILDMSSHITNEMRMIEEYINYCQSISRRKAVEIGILWLFSLAIVIVLRVSLATFYSSLLNQPIYLVSILVLMAVTMISFYLLVRKIIKLEVRGINYGK